MNADANLYLLNKRYLDNLTNPFGFLVHIAQEKGGGSSQLENNDREDLREQMAGDTKFHKQEKMYEAQLDETARKIALSFNYRQVPWLGLTYVVLFI